MSEWVQVPLILPGRRNSMARRGKPIGMNRSTKMASMDAEFETALTPVVADLIHDGSLSP